MVVKFSLHATSFRAEGLVLLAGQDVGVWGVAQVCCVCVAEKADTRMQGFCQSDC